MATPVVAVTVDSATARWGVWSDMRAAVLPWNYLAGITEAGGSPVLMPPIPGAAEDVLARVDALMLTGGPDIDPGLYGAERDARTWPPDQARDTTELTALAVAERRGIPVLAICRGLQLLAISRGGRLHQHLPKHAPAAPGRFGPTRIRIRTDSHLGAALGSAATVYCHHHQGVDRLGTGLVPTAWSDDGGIEAAEDPTVPFLVGVQAHPEESADSAELFAAFVKAVP